MDRVLARQPRLTERRHQVFESTLRHTIDHRLDRRMIQRLQQLAVDDVRFDLVSDQLEQRAQALARIRHFLQVAEHAFLLHRFPALQRRLQQGVAGRKVPVKAALGHAETTRQGFDRHRGDTLFGDEIERGLRPVVGTETGIPRRCGGSWVGAWSRHDPI